MSDPDIERFKALIGMHLMSLPAEERRAEMQRIVAACAALELQHLESSSPE